MFLGEGRKEIRISKNSRVSWNTRGKGARSDAVNRCNGLNYILLLQSKEYRDNKSEISLKRVL